MPTPLCDSRVQIIEGGLEWITDKPEFLVFARRLEESHAALLAELKQLAERAHNYFTVDDSVWDALAAAKKLESEA